MVSAQGWVYRILTICNCGIGTIGFGTAFATPFVLIALDIRSYCTLCPF